MSVAARTDAERMRSKDEERIAAVARQLGTRIREARRSKHITLEKLSKDTDLSPGFLSRLERGETSASISNLIVIAGRLQIPLGDFFKDSEASAYPEYVLSRAEDRHVEMPGEGYTYHLSSGDLADQRMSAFELTFPPGEEMHPNLVTHHGEEVLYLLEGTIEFQIGKDTFVMQPGDCAHFNSETPHMGRSIGDRPARLLMVVTPVDAMTRG